MRSRPLQFPGIHGLASFVVRNQGSHSMPSAGLSKAFSSILCPVDFSDHSRVALQFAAAVSRRASAPLHVMFVNDPLLVAAASAAYDSAGLGAASEAELRRFVASTLPAGTVTATAPQFSTCTGKPPREILQAVLRNRHDLVVLGTKGLNGARRLLLGSTTAQVLRRASVPVLAVPPAEALADWRRAVAPGWPGTTIVAAIELGPRAAHDVQRAADVAAWFGARLVLLHVVPVPTAPYWFSADLDAHLRRSCDKADTALQALQAQLGVRSSVSVRVGHPPDEIATVAGEQKAGLIVMALRGRSGLFGEPAGSCAYQVLCRGVAPVLALPDLRRAARKTA